MTSNKKSNNTIMSKKQTKAQQPLSLPDYETEKRDVTALLQSMIYTQALEYIDRELADLKKIRKTKNRRQFIKDASSFLKQKKTEINRKLKQEQKSSTPEQVQKREVKELRQKLKDTTDVLNYQNFLYRTERKRNVRIELADKIEKLEQMKKELETKINTHIVVNEAKEKRQEKRQEKERIQKEKSVAKIQRWYKKQYTEKIKYSVNVMVFRSELVETYDDETLNKKLETYRRMKIKFFFKYTFNKSMNKFDKTLFVQRSRPTNISIKMAKTNYEKYNEKYTYNELVVKDKFRQMIIDKQGKLTKAQERVAFENTINDFNKLVSICRRDENFKEMYDKYGSYIDAIYLYNAEAHSDKTEPMDIMNLDLYQAIDNNAICFKHIDYTLNKKAETFKDLFQFAESNSCVSSNLKANSCYFNLIIATYKEAIERVTYKHEKCYEDLTPDSLCEYLYIENKEQDLGLSIHASLKFFEKFHLGLVVVNIYDEFIYKYIPEKRNKNVFPQTLYILVYNNHCFKLNSNEKSFIQKLNNKEVMNEEKETYDNLKNSLSTRFYFRNFDKEATKKFIDDLEDVVDCIKDNEEKENIEFITNTDLTQLLFQMIDNKYTPYVNFETGILSRLCFKIKSEEEDENPVIYSIKHGDSSLIYDEIMPVDQNMSPYDIADRKIYEWLLNKNNISQRNEYIREIENKYQMSPLSGYFGCSNTDTTYNAVDLNKAYTSNLIDIQRFPVFSVFDIFLPYDGHQIEDYTQYIVQCQDTNNEVAILFKKTYSRCYGYKLNGISNINYTIIYYRRPSKLNDAYSNKHIDNLYKSKICEDETEDIDKKKFIVNKNLGLLEKKYNSASITKIYQTLAEAQYYQIKYGGNIYKVTDQQFEEVDPTDEEVNEGVISKAEQNGRKIYVLVNSVKKELEESFNPIKDLIYDIQLLKLWKLYKHAQDNNIFVYGIKTDCLLVREDKKTLDGIFKFSKNIGGVKFEQHKKLINKKICMFTNDLMHFKQPEVNIIRLKDEYDVNEIKEKLQQYDRVYIGANLPGSGKTTSVKNSGYKLEFVTPYNKLCQELRKEKYDSITLNKLLNINVMGDYNKCATQQNISEFEAICFDEIKLYGPHYLAKINDFMNKTNKKVFATGDSNQIRPFGFCLNNVKNIKEYLDRCIDIMFPNQIMLEYNKRLKTKKDQEKLKQIKEDIFNLNIDIGTTMRKYFRVIKSPSELKTTKNISFFNFRAERINKVLQDREKNIKTFIKFGKNPEFKFYEGLELVCKKYYKAKDKRLFTNYTYIIDKIDNKTFTINEPVDNIKMTFELKFLSYFKLPYCLTVHSVQGLSIDDEVTLLDCNTPYVDRNFVWTAITRVRELDNITYYEHSPDEIQRLQESQIMQYLKLKIENYKKQDIDAKRNINVENYIDVNWLMNEIGKHDYCSLCNCQYYMVRDGNNDIRCNISVDRIDCEISHEKENCHLLCVECNCKKSCW